ncbi:2-dehydropantoate 2-reductase [Niveispirillum sp. SYP-B3756]|uniref:ketopantoate reductase family protein n=1 Tax=Niveispirillum sp. SYP-B3756 TaxID=2662178 RepID=UPI00129185B1|nr:ketopantoate reductase family protein [Niveispirillum sp. SYP-B3756]MQP66679.1 2-dehydropantoate 2-reductase [Niveispirillum sp. SYP-B3756]
MRILFLGAGGVGGYFGGRLMEAGANVSFLVRPRRQAQLMENLLRVESPHGNIRLPAQTITKARKPYDLVVLACKAFDLDGAMETIQPAIGPETLILPLLNGLNHIDRLDAAFGAERVMGGLCHIPITMDPDGTIRHLSGIHRLIFGARSANQQPMVDRLAASFAGTSVEWSQSDSIMLDMWEKFFFLATLAASTCLMRGSVGDVNSLPGGTSFMNAMLDEATAVATASGYAPRGAVLERYRGEVTDAASTINASMARDVARGNRTEAEHIVGDIVRRGEEWGIASPLLGLGLLHLRVYERQLAAKAARSAT